MRRRLLVGFAAILIVGALLDATVHRDVTGAELPTVGEREAARAADAGIPLQRSVPTLVGEALDMGAVDGRFAFYLALRERAPGATVLLDETSDASSLPAFYLRTFAAAGDVRPVNASAVVAPGGPPSAAGTFRNGPWALHLAGGPVTDVVVLERGGVMHAVDVRRIPTFAPPGGLTAAGALLPAAEITSARPAADPPTLLRAIVLETLVLGGLVFLGGLLLPRRPTLGSGRTVLAGLVGVALHGTLGLLLLPGLWGLAATVAATGMAALLLRRAGVIVGWSRSDLGTLAGVLAALAVTVIAARLSAFLTFTADSFHYWAASAAFADGTFGVADLELKRGVVQPAIHAVGFALGIEGLQSAGPAVAVLGLLLLIATAGTARGRLLAVSLAVALLLSTQLRAMAAFLGSHMLVAVLLVGLVVLVGTARTHREELAALPAVLSLAGAIVLLRAEGVLLVALVLLGIETVASERSRWPAAWLGLGAIAVGWAFLLASGPGDASGGLPVALVLLALLGVAIVAAVPVRRLLPSRLRMLLPTMVGLILWAVALWLLRRDTVNFLDAVAANVGRGAGGWGVAGPLLLVAGALAVVATRTSADPIVRAGRLLVVGFIPLSLIVKLGDGLQAPGSELGMLLEGGGRLGWGDSVNRMWMHAVPVVILLLARSADSSSDRRPDRGEASGVPVAARLLSGVSLLAFGTAVVVGWQPDYVPGLVTTDEQVLRQVVGEAAMVELIDGATVEQDLLLPPATLDPDRRITGLCVDVPFVTFDRRTVGDVTLAVSAGDLESARTYDARDIADWVPIRTCLDLPEPVLPADTDLLDRTVSVSIAGSGAPPGLGVGVLQEPGFRPGATLRVPDAGTIVRGESGHLVSDVVLLVERPLGLLDSPIERSVRILPTLALLLALGVFAATGRRGS